MSASEPAAEPVRRARRRNLTLFAAGAAIFAVITVIAVRRGGLLDLPAAPPGVTAESAGLANLNELTTRGRALEALASGQRSDGTPADSALVQTAAGLAAIRRDDSEHGLAMMRTGLGLAPCDLVLGNGYRMAVLQLRRANLAGAARRQTLAGQMPAWLEHEPIATLERLHAEHPCRETALQLALAWVDELILFGALEIKAPANVESVHQLTELLRQEPMYVPALFGRGLNYLNRPARLLWREGIKTAPDAASHDLGLCVAIGRRVGGAPPQLVATLALALGDAFAKEGHPERARSWWQIAGNTSRDPALTDSIRRRFGWRDDEVLDRLETELASRMLDLDHPLSDLSFMWR